MKKGPHAALHAMLPAAGTIKSLDAVARTVTLDTGEICQCDHTVDLAGFKSNDKVMLTFADNNGKSECCAMTKAG